MAFILSMNPAIDLSRVRAAILLGGQSGLWPLEKILNNFRSIWDQNLKIGTQTIFDTRNSKMTLTLFKNLCIPLYCDVTWDQNPN